MVNKPSNISECLIDHVYIKETFMEEFFTHATLRIVIKKNAADFRTVP